MSEHAESCENRENWYDYLAQGVCAVKIDEHFVAAERLLLLNQEPPRLGLLIAGKRFLL